MHWINWKEKEMDMILGTTEVLSSTISKLNWLVSFYSNRWPYLYSIIIFFIVLFIIIEKYIIHPYFNISSKFCFRLSKYINFISILEMAHIPLTSKTHLHIFPFSFTVLVSTIDFTSQKTKTAINTLYYPLSKLLWIWVIKRMNNSWAARGWLSQHSTLMRSIWTQAQFVWLKVWNWLEASNKLERCCQKAKNSSFT